jgi:lysophospholipase
MNESSKTYPDLESRFLPPEGWRWHEFKNPQGRKLRFGTVAPESRVPDAVVIGLQGLSEYTEKYFETAHDLLGRNLSFWMMDWQGQGKSDRPLKNPQKRHSTSFDEDIADLHFFINEYVKHSAVHPDVGRIPLVMLGHSMGANIGLRYLHRHPDTFACAAFLAPMMGINAFGNIPLGLSLAATGLFKTLAGGAYVGFGKRDWHPENRSGHKMDIFSSDPIRREIQNAWLKHDPDLRIGHVTYGWVHEALNSCARLQKKNVLADIKTPCLFALSGEETLVNNNVARKAIKRIDKAHTIEIPEAKHEILMETDGIRNQFFNAFFELLSVNKISEQLKPF